VLDKVHVRALLLSYGREVNRLDDLAYNNIVDHIDSIMVYAKCVGATWEDLEQILHDSMKQYNITTGEEAKQWYTYTS
jgi:hypothetical protein